MIQRQTKEEEEKERLVQTKSLYEGINPFVQRQAEEKEKGEEKKEEEREEKVLAKSIFPIQKILRKQEEEKEEKEIQTKSISNAQSFQRKTEPEREEETLQAKQSSHSKKTMDMNLEEQINSIKGGGHTLPTTTRTFFEQRFGFDFSSVRVHNDFQSANMAQNLKAQAFTLGRNIVFGSGRYAPGTMTGKRLLAHELTHVVQQQKSYESIQRDVKKIELTPQEEFDWDIGILKSKIAELKNLRISPEQKRSRINNIIIMYIQISFKPYFVNIDPKVRDEIKKDIMAQINLIVQMTNLEFFINIVKAWLQKQPKRFKDEFQKLVFCMTSEGLHFEPNGGIRKVIEKLPWKKCLIEFAVRHCPDVENLTEEKKQEYIKTDVNCTTAILLYEFATGTGPPARKFREAEGAEITKALKKGRGVELALDDFYEKNKGKNVDELSPTSYEYKFSPDIKLLKEKEIPQFLFDLLRSLEEHEAAIKEVGERGTWSSFLVAGVKIKVIPKGTKLHIIMKNVHSKKSLMFHVVPEVKRDPGKLTELGTIEQLFEFDVPLEPERLKTTIQKTQEMIEEKSENIKSSIIEAFDALTNPENYMPYPSFPKSRW